MLLHKATPHSSLRQRPSAVNHVQRCSLSIQQSRQRASLLPCRTAAAELGSLLDDQQRTTDPAAQHNSSSSSSAQQHTASSAAAAPAAAAASDSELFNWTQAWYPIAAVSALKKDAPSAQQLLGMRLVVWWDAITEAWRCFEDLCPHRLAPLSEGRLHESGQLQCTYHGWTFDAQGSCTSIPQIGDSKAHATACSSSRSCVKSFPVYEHKGLLWVYADSTGTGIDGSSSSSSNSSNGSNGKAGGAVRPPAHLLADEEFEIKSPWFQRDVPLSYDILLENFLDPAHVPHSHHGVVGDRDAQATMSMTLDQPPSKQGFSLVVHTPARFGPGEVPLSFRPPCLVRHNFPGVNMLLYGIPTAPGHSRVIMTFIGPPGSSQTRLLTPMLPPMVNAFVDLTERFPALQHALNRNAIIDGDTYFLHAAERVLYERGDATSWRRQYFMPGSSDAAVLALRKWLDSFGAALPVLPRSAADIPPLMPREVVLDRLTNHTQNCPHCSAALRGATIAAALMAAVAAVAAGSIVAAVVGGTAALLSPFTGAAAAVAVAAGLATAALLKFRQLFIFTDYVHAEH